MIELNVIDENGNDTGKTVELPQEIFGIEPNTSVVHQAVVAHLANKRQGNASTKTRAEVSGGGKKPWRQKGTGRARVGTIRSPLWKGGGVTFGPRKRDYTKKLNKKMRTLAIRSVLSDKAKDGDITCIDKLEFEYPKTSRLNTMKINIGCEGVKTLIIVDKHMPELVLSARNLERFEVSIADKINTYDIINAEKLLITSESLSIIKEVFAP